MDPSESALPVASGRLGSFRLLEILGSGAMGTVWLAQDEEEGRRVALKVFHPQMLAHETFLVRFMREAQAGSRVDHPNVVRTWGSEMLRVDGVRRCFLVMEYVEGKTLRALLGEMRQVPEALVREIGRQVAAGLAAIHAAGIVHRDVKPENVLVTPEHDVRVMDLGVSKLLDATKVLTQEGHFAGSLAYAAPEQIQGREVSFAADLYALGVLLQELVTGRNPFDRESSGAVVRAHLLDEPPDLLDEAPDATPFLGEVVRTLLAKDPAERFASAADLEATLASGESSAWWKSREDDAARRRARIPRVPVRRETVLHGRAEDLALLRTSWEAARSGRGNTVLLVGEAGIGKSRLVDAFLSELKTADAHVLYGSWPPFGGMGAITDAIVANLGAGDLEERIRRHVPESPLLAAPLAALLLHEPAPAGSVSLQGDALRAAIVRLMQGLATGKPLVWVIEDLHFADEDARAIALSLARAVGGRRVLLVLTSRPGLPEPVLSSLERLENLRRTELARLGAREVMLLLREALRNERLAEKLCGRVALASDGNPFFIFETIRALRQGQLITQNPDGTWVDTKVIDAIPVPPAVRDLVEARLSDLARGDRELLDLGAVQGFEFDADVVATVVGRKRFEVLRDLAQIERTSGVVRSAGRRYRFDHHQIQEIVYSDLSEPLREECHAATAEAIERRERALEAGVADLDDDVVVGLADHFLRGARGASAIRYVGEAGDRLARRYEWARAAELAERALAVPGLLGGTERVRCLLRLCRAGGPLDNLALRGRQEEAALEAERLADEAGDDGLRCEAAKELGWCLHETARMGEVEATARRVLALATARGDARAAAAARGMLGNVLRFHGELRAAREEYELVLELNRLAGHRGGEGSAEARIGNLAFEDGDLAEARTRYDRAGAIFRETGDRRAEARVRMSLGNVAFREGRLAAALDVWSSGLALLREVGDRVGEVATTVNLACILHERGRFDAALAQFDRAVAVAREIGHRGFESNALHNLGMSLAERGEFAAACERFRASLAIREATGDRKAAAFDLLSLGETLREAGDGAAAGECLRSCARVAAALGLTGVEVLAECHLAALGEGDWGVAAARLCASEPTLDPKTRLRSRFLLWEATRDRVHLVEARRALDDLVAPLAPELRDEVLAGHRVNRRTLAACRELQVGVRPDPGV